MYKASAPKTGNDQLLEQHHTFGSSALLSHVEKRHTENAHNKPPCIQKRIASQPCPFPMHCPHRPPPDAVRQAPAPFRSPAPGVKRRVDGCFQSPYHQGAWGRGAVRSQTHTFAPVAQTPTEHINRLMRIRLIHSSIPQGKAHPSVTSPSTDLERGLERREQQLLFFLPHAPCQRPHVRHAEGRRPAGHHLLHLARRGAS